MKWRIWLIRGAAALTVLALVAGLVVVGGVIPVAASAGHWPVTAWLLHFSMERSVATHSLGVEPPESRDLERAIRIGAGHYQIGCAQCHGHPGARRWAATRALTPTPPRLTERVDGYEERELYYIVYHGIMFTSMPPWPDLERPDEVWSLVAFLRALPDLNHDEYAALTRYRTEWSSDTPEVVRRRCASCHDADGDGDGSAFPRLAGQHADYLADALRAYIEGARHSGTMQTAALPLDDREIALAASWYARQRPGRRPEVDLDQVERGATIARSGIPDRLVPACADCHGPKEGSVHPHYPLLDGQYAEYTVEQLTLFNQETRGGAAFRELMQLAAEHRLAPSEMAAVAAFYASRFDAR